MLNLNTILGLFFFHPIFISNGGQTGGEIAMVGKRAVKPGAHIEIIAARLPTLQIWVKKQTIGLCTNPINPLIRCTRFKLK